MMKTQTHLMIDLETLDTSPYAVILSVGAVAFTKDTVIAEKEWFLDVDQQVSQGRKIGYETAKWWVLQSDTAKKGVFNPAFKHFLTNFSMEMVEFFNKNCGSSGFIWGNGASFDIPILETLLKRNLGSADIPWKFWFHRCYRTVKQMYGIEKDVQFRGVKHGALTDAFHQAKCLQTLFQKNPELEK